MMQYDNHDTDKMLKQLENQSLPDLSKMDQHWEQMKTTITADTQPGSNGSIMGKSGLYVLAATIIGLLVLVAVMFYKKSATDEQAISKTPAVQVAPTDTTETKTDHRLQNTTVPPLRPAEQIMTSTQTRTLKIPSDRMPSSDYSAQLKAFFSELEKPSQEFVINHLKDTVIHGLEGSLLMVPAYTFSKGPVTILLKEFYSYSDMIIHRLNTTSDNEQLISGGMLHVTAMVDGQEVTVQPGKSIRWFLPGNMTELSEMQLFTGTPARDNRLNWTPRQQYFKGRQIPQQDISEASNQTIAYKMDTTIRRQTFIDTYFTVKVRVLDLRNEPFKTKSTKNGTIATFRLSDNSTLDKTELQTLLKEKYGYYKVNVIEKQGLIKEGINADGVGDSIWVDQRIAKRYNLPASDTFVTKNFRVVYSNGYDSVANKTFITSLNTLSERFSVDLPSLGWINCDRFYKDRRPKIPFFVNLQDKASNYYTLLVFDGIKSMMMGASGGNYAIFENVPEGMKAKVMCIGIKNGIPVIASKEVVLSRTIVSNLEFEETTASDVKQQAAKMDK